MKKLKVEYDKLNKQYIEITEQLTNYKNNDVLSKYNDLVKEKDELIEQVKRLQEDIKKQGEDKDKIIDQLQKQLNMSISDMKDKDKLIDDLKANESGIYDEWKKYGTDMEAKVEALQEEIKRLVKSNKDVPVSIILNKDEDKVIAVVNEEGTVEALPSEIPLAPPLEIFPVTEVKESEKKNLFDQIKKGKQLKTGEADITKAPKATVDLLDEIRNGPKLKKIKKCDLGFVWDQKEGKCLPVVKKSIISSSLQDKLREDLAKIRGNVESEESEEENEFNDF